MASGNNLDLTMEWIMDVAINGFFVRRTEAEQDRRADGPDETLLMSLLRLAAPCPLTWLVTSAVNV
jgi:hypothetical protein